MRSSARNLYDKFDLTHLLSDDSNYIEAAIPRGLLRRYRVRFEGSIRVVRRQTHRRPRR